MILSAFTEANAPLKLYSSVVYIVRNGESDLKEGCALGDLEYELKLDNEWKQFIAGVARNYANKINKVLTQIKAC